MTSFRRTLSTALLFGAAATLMSGCVVRARAGAHTEPPPPPPPRHEVRDHRTYEPPPPQHDVRDHRTHEAPPPDVRDHRRNETVVVREYPVDPPPAPQSESPGDRRGYVWITGYYKWNNGGYEWFAGHWERKRAGKAWRPGVWERKGDRYIWIEGSWY